MDREQRTSGMPAFAILAGRTSAEPPDMPEIVSLWRIIQVKYMMRLIVLLRACVI